MDGREPYYQITPEQLKMHGFRAVLTDLVDNTLIAWNNPNGEQKELSSLAENDG